MKGGSLYSIILLILMFAIMYFLMIRPQKKQQQRWQDMINGLKKGDHVITRGGLHGVIDDIDKANKTVTLDCDGIFLEFSLNAIGNVQSNNQTQAAVKVAEPTKKSTQDATSKSDDEKTSETADNVDNSAKEDSKTDKD